MNYESELPVPRRVRGRPRSASRLRVTEQLLQATERLLKQVSHLELTERRIAAEAGVDEAMIRYYFGGKDGLLLDLTLRHCDEVEEQIVAFHGYDGDTSAVTQRIVQTMIDCYHSRPWIMRIMISETTRRDSLIRSRFIERFGPVGVQGIVAGPVRALIERLQAAGVYRQDVDAAQTTMSLIAIITGSMIIAPMSGQTETSLAYFRGATWVAHVTELFEARLLTRVKPASAASPAVIATTPRRKR